MFLQTRSGDPLDFQDPDPNSIHIEDIAHALALTCRYNGHTPFPYSVAQHCVLASYAAPHSLELEALLHDAQEAYVGDMPSPLKKMLPGYQVVEDKLEAVIRKKFGLPEEFSPGVKEVDMRMLVTEARAFGFKLWVPTDGIEPYDEFEILPWSWKETKLHFLARFELLTRLLGTR